MFTGLIQALGKIERYDRQQIAIACSSLSSKLALGDSISVNGVCLTVAEILSTGFVADVSPETLSRSNLGQQRFIPVNLEAALAVGDKLGGHFVSGHIDGTGILSTSKMQGGAWELRFKAPESVARYIVAKGSIAINGISLTVAECNAAGTMFSVAVIPHSYENTNLKYLQIGNSVNLEADVLGKYVEKFLRHNLLSASDSSISQPTNHTSLGVNTDITSEFLAEHGW